MFHCLVKHLSTISTDRKYMCIYALTLDAVDSGYVANSCSQILVCLYQ